MRGRDFLKVARPLPSAPSEAHCRASIVHSYYALMLECRDALAGWGRDVPPRQNVHAFVRLTLSYSRDPILREIGDIVDWLVRERNQASYDLGTSPKYSTNQHALRSVDESERGIRLLDDIDSDPVRRTTAIAALP